MRQVPRQPDEKESKIEPVKDVNLIVQTREYELITPLFGGGVEPGQCDDLTPIRGTEIRGHLRFWWRATCGGNPMFDGKVEKMKDAEDKLWGAGSAPGKPMPSQIQINVVCQNTGSEKHPFEVLERRDRSTGRIETYPDGTPKSQLLSHSEVAPSYVAFPLQPTQKEMKPKWKSKAVREHVRFLLRISFPRGTNDQTTKEVAAALWAWETFGGIGARTRRGFGALRLIRVVGDPTPPRFPDQGISELYKEIKKQLEEHVAEDSNWPDGVPHLSPESVFDTTGYYPKSHQAWETLVNRLREFRQKRNPGSQRNRPGRSKWTEPEAIRRITNQRLAKTIPGKPSEPIHQSIQPNFMKFPRAAFGLPIVFHFQNPKGRKTFDKDSDPRKTVLKLESSERLASPLILRPIPVANNKYVGLALILDGTGEPSDLRLALFSDEDKDKSLLRDGLEADLEQHEADQIIDPDRETLLLNGKTDVLYAFLDYLIHEEDE